jgi:hypothetical protein
MDVSHESISVITAPSFLRHFVPGRFAVQHLAIDVVVHLPVVVLGLDNKEGCQKVRGEVLSEKHAPPLVT